MHCNIASYAALAASLVKLAHAVDSVTVSDTIAAGSSFQLNATDIDSTDKYRVYLAAALGGDTGPTCWLSNSTSLSSSSNFTIPPEVGPEASYYSIGVSDVASDSDADDIVYSNRFTFTGGTGNYSQYETHLNGNPFWDADSLPCTAYACARKCADASYPDDLSDPTAYGTMRKCIQDCPGVSETSQTAPAAPTSASTGSDTAIGASATEMADSDENGAPVAAAQQIMIVGMASAASFAILFL
ncbi:hypothetical protein KVR01_010406 [Diaporthe batatas]|uniref:uncharacterized protein n=1 Tax=Diaporthe batatas TaxID=748121 RepID=UPI001D0431AD|nr:uncharacterized protein KVR01_010406 [Diaporthe batatas]KAG8159769.1 hypothetical protein KVR01_010406 [Diaporthe batatas]